MSINLIQKMKQMKKNKSIQNIKKIMNNHNKNQNRKNYLKIKWKVKTKMKMIEYCNNNKMGTDRCMRIFLIKNKKEIIIIMYLNNFRI